MGWKPIETAPKDETVVLLFCPERWDTAGVVVAFWSEDFAAWYEREASSHSVSEEPTHWMPLPAPPAA